MKEYQRKKRQDPAVRALHNEKERLRLQEKRRIKKLGSSRVEENGEHEYIPQIIPAFAPAA